MGISKKILNYLKKNDIEVKIQGHKKVYTAYDLAKTLNEKLDKIGKTLLVKADGKPYLVLVPGHYYLDLGKIKRELKVKKVELADEKHIKEVLDMKPGALYPFAKMHKLELLLDKALLKSKDAIVRAGSFTESLRVKVKDLHKMENATIGDFGKAVLKSVKGTPKKVKKVASKARKITKKAKKAVKRASKSKYVKKAMKKKPVKKAIKKVKKAIKKSPVKVKIRKIKIKGKKAKKVARVTISKLPAIKRKRRKK